MWRRHFNGLGDVVWLNAAHQGPLPDAAIVAALGALHEKQRPSLIDDATFWTLPDELRGELARLLDARKEDVVLANSASYGLHLLANALDWSGGDEVVVVRGDFPSNVLPWGLARRRGVRVREVTGEAAYPTASELSDAIGARTRLLCVSQVHSFSGRAVDVAALSAACRRKGTVLVVNASQSAGVRPLSVAHAGADAVVSVGFKWLCGPYGTGFLWLSPRLQDRLAPQKDYWLDRVGPSSLAGRLQHGSETDSAVAAGMTHSAPPPSTAVVHDVFGTANFLNFAPWLAALRLLNRIGIQRIGGYVDTLVDAFLADLDRDRFALHSPRSGRERSSLVLLRPRRGERPERMAGALAREGIHVAARAGHLRISPHLYNSVDEVGRAARTLSTLPALC